MDIYILCVCVCVCVCVWRCSCHKTYEIYFGNFIFYRNDETFNVVTYTLIAICLEVAFSDKRRAKASISLSRRLWVYKIILYMFRYPHFVSRYVTHTKFSLGAFAKLRKATVSFVKSVCPSAWKTPILLEGFSWNFIFHIFFSKICRKFSSFV